MLLMQLHAVLEMTETGCSRLQEDNWCHVLSAWRVRAGTGKRCQVRCEAPVWAPMSV